MTDFGMAFDDRDVTNNPGYTTARNRLQVDLNNPVKLFDVLRIPAGTNASVVAGPGGKLTESLLVVQHGLGYIPQVYVVFTLYNKGGTTPVYYAINIVLLAEGGAGTDLIECTINEANFSIDHVVDFSEYDSGSGGFTFTSTAGNYDLGVKYLICNNEQIQTNVLE